MEEIGFYSVLEDPEGGRVSVHFDRGRLRPLIEVHFRLVDERDKFKLEYPALIPTGMDQIQSWET